MLLLQVYQIVFQWKSAPSCAPQFICGVLFTLLLRKVENPESRKTKYRSIPFNLDEKDSAPKGLVSCMENLRIFAYSFSVMLVMVY